MNPRKRAATPLAVEEEPPGDPKDEISSQAWGNRDSSAPSGDSPSAHAQRKSRLVGSVVDASVADDGLGLSGPGAPSHSFSEPQAGHPVRARLLERAQMAQSGSTPIPPHVETDPSAVSSADVSGDFTSPYSAPPPSTYEPGEGGASVLPPPSPLPGTPPPAAVASELARIARRPSSSSAAPHLSPNIVALLGGLVGLTAISTLGLVLGQSEGRLLNEPAQAAVATIATPAEEKATTKSDKAKRAVIDGPWRIKNDEGKPGRRVIEGKIGKNAFLRAIQEAGLPKNEAYRVYTALKGLKDLDHCKSSDTFKALLRGQEKSLVAFEYSVNKEEVYQAKENKEGRLEGSKLDLKVSRNQIRRSFTHDGRSFEESARRTGFDPGIEGIAEVSLRGHSTLRDFKKGDRIRLIAQEVTVLGEFSRYSGIEAMEFLREGDESRRIYFYSHPIEGGHFDKNGRAPYEGGWRKPIPNAPVTSKFNMKRMHPVLNKVMPHTGTDFGAPAGTPIGATSPGVVSFRGPAGASGNLIKIKHDGGYESGYAHLSRFANVHVGDKVERLQTVGFCGSTGRSTGPHLHFTMKKDGKFIDAESLNLDGLRVLPKAHRGLFSEVRAKYDPILDRILLPDLIEEVALDPAAPPSGPPPAPAAGMALSPDPMAAEGMAGEVQQETALTPKVEKTATPAAIAPAPRAAKVVEPAQKISPSAIFLSDDELLRMQSRSDDGEVSE